MKSFYKSKILTDSKYCVTNRPGLRIKCHKSSIHTDLKCCGANEPGLGVKRLKFSILTYSNSVLKRARA